MRCRVCGTEDASPLEHYLSKPPGGDKVCPMTVIIRESRVRYSTMAKEDRSRSLRNEVQELREEAAALADRTKKTARHAEVLAARIKYLESQLSKSPSKTTR